MKILKQNKPIHLVEHNNFNLKNKKYRNYDEYKTEETNPIKDKTKTLTKLKVKRRKKLVSSDKLKSLQENTNLILY